MTFAEEVLRLFMHLLAIQTGMFALWGIARWRWKATTMHGWLSVMKLLSVLITLVFLTMVALAVTIIIALAL